jgi:hypothetical protein
MNNLAQDIWGLEWEVNIWSKIYKIMSKLTKQQIYPKFTFDRPDPHAYACAVTDKNDPHLLPLL